MSSAEVRRASADEAARVAHLLARAFADDPIETWCLACDDFSGVSELEFLHVTRQLTDEGLLWVTDDLSGSAAWFPPGASYDDSIGTVVNPVLAAHGGRPDRMIRFWEWVDDHRPTSPHWYVDLMAVDPGLRGRGSGRILLEHGLSRLDGLGGTSFLVSGNPFAVAWYQRHGFTVCSEEEAPEGGPLVTFMVRPPSAG